MLRLLKVSGSHYECGFQIGNAAKILLPACIDKSKAYVLPPFSWAEYISETEKYLQYTKKDFPWVVEELEGVAKGAGVNVFELAATMIEELYTYPLIGKCTDIIADKQAAKGRVIIGHNNDLSPADEPGIVGVEWSIDGEPKILTVGYAGIFTSIGVSSVGLALTGNELNQTDGKYGVPRLLMARVILSAKTFEEALKLALYEGRASSYNNVISCRDGRVVSVEASGTDYELLYPENGILLHTNHYLNERMAKFDPRKDDEPYRCSSLTRYKSAQRLLSLAPKPMTEDFIKNMLRDHDGEPSINTICRHDSEVKTAFSTYIDLTSGIVEVCLGNPCENNFEEIWKF